MGVIRVLYAVASRVRHPLRRRRTVDEAVVVQCSSSNNNMNKTTSSSSATATPLLNSKHRVERMIRGITMHGVRIGSFASCFTAVRLYSKATRDIDDYLNYVFAGGLTSGLTGLAIPGSRAKGLLYGVVFGSGVCLPIGYMMEESNKWMVENGLQSSHQEKRQEYEKLKHSVGKKREDDVTMKVIERMERELLVNTYWQSNGLLLIKRVNKYFPILEPLLKKYGLPDDFKFLALAESDLKFLPPSVVRKIIQSISISNLVLFKLDSEKLFEILSTSTGSETSLSLSNMNFLPLTSITSFVSITFPMFLCNRT